MTTQHGWFAVELSLGGGDQARRDITNINYIQRSIDRWYRLAAHQSREQAALAITQVPRSKTICGVHDHRTQAMPSGVDDLCFNEFFHFEIWISQAHRPHLQLLSI